MWAFFRVKEYVCLKLKEIMTLISMNMLCQSGIECTARRSSVVLPFVKLVRSDRMLFTSETFYLLKILDFSLKVFNLQDKSVYDVIY
jgi:hypothetical protein